MTYLRTATSRSNSKGNYCLSSKDLPAKSKRVIKKLDEMVRRSIAKKRNRNLFKIVFRINQLFLIAVGERRDKPGAEEDFQALDAR